MFGASSVRRLRRTIKSIRVNSLGFIIRIERILNHEKRRALWRVKKALFYKRS
jgi:hypothetical protein